MRTWNFAKGHGTENDFVILLDRTGMIDPGPEVVRYLCDRHAGLGGDGLLRVAPTRCVSDWTADPDDADLWFMDYRNADGSLAEMCGNGARVFARFLLEQNLASGPVVRFGTRAGVQEATVHPDGLVSVTLGTVRVGPAASVRVDGIGRELAGRAADAGNPHLVALLPDDVELTAARLDVAPVVVTGDFPEGVNVELMKLTGPDSLAMRVSERGVGETRSCGTGTVAAAAVAAARVGGVDTEQTWQVSIPGGRVSVRLGAAGADGGRSAVLTGPAVIVAQGQVQVP